MRVKVLFVLLTCSFWTHAHADFNLDDQSMSHVCIPFSSPDQQYKLTTTLSKPKALTPHLKMSSEKVGKFLKSGLTFEEQCILTGYSPSCTSILDNKFYALDPNVQVVSSISSSPLRIFKNESLQLNNCTIIANGPIVLEGDQVQVQGFFKTPGPLTIQALHKDYPINDFSFVPQFFKFESKSGVTLTNSSIYASINVNFKENQYSIVWQGASSLAINSSLLTNSSSNEKK